MWFEYSLASLNNNTNTGTEVSQTGANAEVNSDAIPSFQTEVISREILSTENDFPAYLTQPVTIHNMTWVAATAGGTDDLCCDNVISAWMAAAPTSTLGKISTFNYMTCDVKLTFIVQGSATAYGQLIFCAIPVPRPSGYDRTTRFDYISYGNSRILPHVIIDPSQSATYELTLPMASCTGVYNLRDIASQGSWEVRSFVLDPLCFGTANVVDVRITVRSTLVNPRLSGRTRPLGPDPEELSGKPSAVLAGLGRASGFLGSVFPTLSPYTTLFSEGAGMASGVMRKFGFAKPQTTETSTFILNRTCDNYSQTDGRSTALVLGRSQAQASSIDPGLIGGELSDMSVSHLLSIPVVREVFGLPQATAAATMFKTFGVFPATPSEETNPSFAGLMRQTHEFWTGPITFHFEFVASVFHRATILIAWDPRGSGGTPTYAEALNHLENLTVQVSGNTAVDVEIPWRQSVLAHSTTGANYNGRVYMYVVNPVVANGSTDPIYINVLFSCEKVQFFVPRIAQPRIYQQVNLGAAFARLAALDEEEETVTPLLGDWVESTSHSFGPSTTNDQLANIVTGDQTTNLKDLLSRMLLIGTITTTTAGTRNSIRNVPWNNEGSAETVNRMTWFQMLSPLFMGFRGSFRWSIEGTNLNMLVQNKMENATVNMEVTDTPSGINSYATTFVNSRVASNVDVVAPYLSNNMFLPGSLPRPNTTRGTIVFSIPAATTIGIFSGVGDDFIVGKFLGVPRWVPPA